MDNDLELGTRQRTVRLGIEMHRNSWTSSREPRQQRKGARRCSLVPMMSAWRAFCRRGHHTQLFAICACAIVIATTGCGGASLVRDDLHRVSWYELESSHIKLTTDLPTDSALAHARGLEQAWRALTAMYLLIAPSIKPPREQFSVIHLSDCFAFAEIAPENAGGFVFSSREFSGELIVVTCGPKTAGREVVLHELAHILNSHYFPLSPAWVNEGLATYFQTMEVADGRAVIGRLPRSQVGLWRKPAWLPELSQLLAFDYDEFHRGRNGRNYFAAWKLVHLLNNTSPDYQNRFRGFLAMLNGERKPENAWELAFRGIPSGRLADEYSQYQQRYELKYWTTPYELENPPSAQVRPLAAAEAHAVWAHLLSLKRPDDALLQLDLAAQVDPEWAEVFYWRARLLQRLKRTGADEQAAASLREYREKRPDDVRGWYALLDLELDRVVPADHLGLEETPPPGIEKLAWIARGLVERAKRPSDLNMAAWYYAMSRDADAGVPLAIQSVQGDPGCAGCWDTLALLYFQKGDSVRARLAQERAINMYHEVDPHMQSRLRRYRAVASADAP
jgi:tetratricopeptide (TPR) repeat protein